MPCRKPLIVLSIFHAIVNTIYLVRFFGVLAPEPVVYGYVVWFMSFAIANSVFTILAWVLWVALLKKCNILATVAGLALAGGLFFHALNGFMFLFYSGSLSALSTFNVVFEIVVYLYGLALATFFITKFTQYLSKISAEKKENHYP